MGILAVYLWPKSGFYQTLELAVLGEDILDYLTVADLGTTSCIYSPHNVENPTIAILPRQFIHWSKHTRSRAFYPNQLKAREGEVIAST